MEFSCESRSRWQRIGFCKLGSQKDRCFAVLPNGALGPAGAFGPVVDLVEKRRVVFAWLAFHRFF